MCVASWHILRWIINHLIIWTQAIFVCVISMLAQKIIRNISFKRSALFRENDTFVSFCKSEILRGFLFCMIKNILLHFKTIYFLLTFTEWMKKLPLFHFFLCKRFFVREMSHLFLGLMREIQYNTIEEIWLQWPWHFKFQIFVGFFNKFWCSMIL